MLFEKTIDLDKINAIGAKIIQATEEIDEKWKVMMKYHSNMYDCLQLYGSYLMEVANDRVAGEELFKKAQQILTMNTQSLMQRVEYNFSTIYISTDDVNISIKYQ